MISGRESLLMIAIGFAFLRLPNTSLALDPSRDLSQYNCKNWTRQNGFPANAVSAITQTRDSYLWMGTQNGLVRYDGVEFKVVELPKTAELRSQYVSSLAPSRGGGLWFGVKDGAFGRYDTNGFNKVTEGSWVKAWMNVLKIEETDDGNLWVGSSLGVALCPGGDVQKAIFNADLAWTSGVRRDNRGRVWLGTIGSGLWLFENGEFKKFPDSALQGGKVLAVTVDPHNNLWVGTSTGLLCYDSELKPVPVPNVPDQVRVLLVDSQGSLWVGTGTSGLYRYRGGHMSRLKKEEGLVDDSVNAIFEDHEGSVWIGTRDGLSQITDVKFPIYGGAEGLLEGMYHDTCSSAAGGFWAASTVGISWFDGSRVVNLSTEAGLTNTYIRRVFESKNGDVYVMNGQQEIQVLSNGRVLGTFKTKVWPSAFAEDSHGVVVAVYDHLFRASRDGLEPYRFKPGAAPPEFYYIRNLWSCPDGSLLVATVNGAFRLRDGALAEHWSADTGLADNEVLWISQSDNDLAWAGTPSGMALLSNGRAFAIREKDGLFDDYVTAIVPDRKGNLWANSHRGIFRVDMQSAIDFANRRRTNVLCTGFDGVESVKTVDRWEVESSGTRSTDGRIWFASPKGVILIDPEHVHVNSVVPPVRVERALVNGMEIPRSGPALRPGRGDLEFDCAALSFVSPHRVRFRYRLEGYDLDWIEAGNRRSAYYTGIKPGNYVFRVQACNEDEVWNTTGDQFALTLPPHFYETRWFKALCGLAVGAALLGGYGWRVRQLHRRQKILQEMNVTLEARVTARTDELAAQRNLLRTLIDHLPDGIFVKDTDGRVVIDNVSHAKSLGFNTPAEAVGKLDAECLPADVAKKSMETDRRVLATGEVYNAEESTVNRETGTPAWSRTTKVPLHDGEGKVIGLAGIQRDITERKEWEERFASMHNQLLEASRQAGMAEVATDILHNAGNALTSVNVSANLITEGLRQFRTAVLAKAADLVQEHAADLGSFFASDERGRKLPAYLKQLAHSFSDQQAALLAEARNLSKHIDHIGNIIGAQQAHAGSTDVSQTFQPAELLDEAIHGFSQDTERSLQIIREFADTRPIRTDRHNLLRILGTLLHNAAQACGDPNINNPAIIVRLAESGTRIRIEVAHNGTGIASKDLNRIFSQRFSAGTPEHDLDLHNAALAAMQAGGSLTALSDGLSRGATFTLELPFDKPPERRQHSAGALGHEEAR